MRGIKLVNAALNVFLKAKEKLNFAVTYCCDEIEALEIQEHNIRTDITELIAAKDKANRVIEALNKIIEA